MAAVTLREGEEFDCSDVYKQVVNYLPSYARPRFIRCQVLVFSSSHQVPYFESYLP